jgi:mannan endo-1,4-beta-mannosidase
MMKRIILIMLALASTRAMALTPPSITAATAVSSTEIDLTWLPAQPDAGGTITGYTVSRNGSVVATLGPSATTYKDTGLSPATTYQYVVGATEQVLVASASVSAQTQAGPPPPPPGTIPATASRPSYNTGNGFFVVGRGIYDANGNLFIPIGANRQHYDTDASTRFQAKPNAERLIPFFNQSWAAVNKPLMDEDVNNKVVPIPTVFYTNYTNGTETTGKSDLSTLNTAVNFWTSQAANWTTYNHVAMFNIANEWGPCSDDSNAANYQNGYVSAVQTMRRAGYTAPLVVDAGCSGQGFDQIISSAAAIEAADPLHNVVFSIHNYGEFYVTTPFCNGCGWQWGPAVAQLVSLGVPVIFGEFGCGVPCGDFNSTPVTPDILMQTLQQNQMGWLAWSWDDGGCTFNLLGPCPNNTGVWSYSNLSAYGKDVILSPGFGMQAVSRPATTFP